MKKESNAKKEGRVEKDLLTTYWESEYGQLMDDKLERLCNLPCSESELEQTIETVVSKMRKHYAEVRNSREQPLTHQPYKSRKDSLIEQQDMLIKLREEAEERVLRTGQDFLAEIYQSHFRPDKKQMPDTELLKKLQHTYYQAELSLAEINNHIELVAIAFVEEGLNPDTHKPYLPYEFYNWVKTAKRM